MTRQHVVGILTLLALFQAACQAPPQAPLPAGAGQLLSERSQVFFQKRGQSAEEVAVNALRVAGAGDEMWTQSHGRALLRFSDLWARLYDDTDFRADDVMPSSIKLTLGTGAVLIGELAQSPQRVEIVAGTPPRVRVILAGTLVMVAYIPSEQIVLVRTFDGEVDVSVLTSGQAIRSGGDGAEWVLVGPDGRIDTPSQHDVRALARRVGFWDQYHQIELDASGFGPQAARIPAERVTMTFVEDAAISPTGVTPPSPKSTPTPTRTPMPMQCAPGVLYCEDFEDGRAPGWGVYDARGKPSSGWQVIREGTNYVFEGEGHQWATLENRSWGDYRVRYRLKLQGDAIHLNYRLGEVGRYFIGFHKGGLSLSRQVGNTFTDLTSVGASHALNRWHAVEIAGWGGHLQVYVDGKLALDYTDTKPLRSGTIAFETLDNSSAQVDDIEVLPAGPESAPAPPMVTPTRTSTPRLTPTRAPPPTRTPTRCAPGVLYCEDFESGRAPDWRLDPAWRVERVGGNFFLSGSGHTWANLDNHSWSDYRATFLVRLLQGAIHLNYRLSPVPGGITRYYVGFEENGLRLSKSIIGGYKDLAQIQASHPLNIWHKVEIAGWGGHIQVSVDGEVELDYIDPDPLLGGAIAFETLDNSSAQVDNIEVMNTGPEPAARPASKPVISDINTSDIVSIGGLHEPECGSSKVTVSARVTSRYRLAKVQMWRSDLSTWSDMVPQGENLYVSIQNFKAGNDFRVRAEDEFGNTTETATLPSKCMRVGFIVSKLSGKCIDVKGSPAVNNEAPLQLWDCEFGRSPEETDQRWGMTSDGFIQNVLSHKCLEVKGYPGVNNEAPLQLWDCEFSEPSTTDQRWELTSEGFIRNRLSGKCIDARGSPAVDNEAPLQLWDCETSSGITDQRWEWR